MKYYLKKCWPTVTAASICMVVAYGLQVCTSLVQIQITQGLLDGDLRAFTIRIILLLLTWLAVVLCLIAETFFQGRAVRRMNNALRRDMAAGLLHKTHQEYHKQESGEYLSQFTNDVNQIEQMAWTPFFTIMGSAAQVVFGIVALASIHWLLLVISLVIALVMIFVPRLFSKRLGTVGTACAASQADSVSKIKDLLAGYDVLRFFGKDERFTSGVDAASDSMEQAKYKLTINKDGIGCGLAYVSAVCQVAVVILLGVLILNDMIPLATFMGTGTICAGVYNGLNQVSKLAVSFSASKPYFDKITIHAGEAQLPDFGLPTLQEGITVKDVSFGYDEKKPILVHMNAEFKKGGKYALTGPSGCGKSTLLKILLGWLPGYQGKVLYDERDVRDYTPEQLQQKMSYIEQNVFLFNTTIRENITLGEHFTDEQMEKALRDSALAGDLANMPKGLDTPVGEEGNALSGGQKQRVAIARALIHNRSILLVDEGTSALDQKNADIVEKSLLSNPDLTLILISHHLSDERKAQFDHRLHRRRRCESHPPIAMPRTIRTEIQKRFSDIDSFRHVNNVSQQMYFDVGKSDFFDRLLGPEILFAPVRIITTATDTSYMGQIRPEDRIAVTTCVERIGTKSLALLQRIVADDGTVRSQSRSVMVAFDFEAQQSVPVPDAWRRALEAE